MFRPIVACWLLVGTASVLAEPPRHASVRPVLAVAGIAGGSLGAAVVVAVHGAVRRLSTDRCWAVLDDFRDVNGRTLREVAGAHAWSAVDVAARAIFRDGQAHASCRSGPVAAFTGAGSRVVFVCGSRFAAIARVRAELVVIHELLHTLGLDERPPTSAEIDRAIERRCGA